jgi:hypothetical protein
MRSCGGWNPCQRHNEIDEQGGEPERRIGRVLKSRVLGRRRVTASVMRTPSRLDGGCANWGWMVAVSAGPFEASRSKGAVSGAAAFRRGKTLARSVQSL